MPVFSKEEGYQLRVYGLVRAEVSAKETADEVSIYRSVVSWEMDVFETSEMLSRYALSFFTWVDLPAPSRPSSTTSMCF